MSWWRSPLRTRGAVVLAGAAAIGVAAWRPASVIGVLALWVLSSVAIHPIRQAPRAVAGAPDPTVAIDRELERSRRHRRPLSLVRIAAGPATTTAPGRARRSDHVWQFGDEVLLLLPESSSLAARQAAARLYPGSTTVVAAFPEDGLTAHALTAAVGRIDLPGGALRTRAREVPALREATNGIEPGWRA